MGKVFLLNELMPEEEIDGVNVQKLFVDLKSATYRV